MEILFQLFLVLLLARLGGELFHHFDQPGSVGEILAGLLFAALVMPFSTELPALFDLKNSEVLKSSAEVGIFTLILVAGIEMEPRKVLEGSKRSIAVALGGMTLPLTLGMALAWAFLPENPQLLVQCLLVGVTLSITAIPASVRVLEDLGVMQTPGAQTIVAAALVDDVLGLFLLAVLIAALETGAFPGLQEIGLMLLKVLGFFAISILFGDRIYPHIRRGVELMQALSVELSVLILASLAYGALAELLGLHWVLGAFMAGLFFEPERVGKKVYEEVRLAVTSLANGLLGPLFFFTIGLQIELSAVMQAPFLVMVLLVAAFAGKILGAGLPALSMGMTKEQSLVVGVGMCSRGAVELVILSLALNAGLFATKGADGHLSNLFSALVITAVVTTLATPALLRVLLRRQGRGHRKTKSPGN